MKNSLNHLPQRKRGELARITATICQKAPSTEMIILFGSYARGDWVEDVTVDGHTTYEYSSDFDILAIVKDKALADNIDLWNDIEDKASKLPVETSVRLIAHDINFLNRQLAKGQYFFSDIKKEGITLYDSKKFELAEAKELSPKEKLGQAKAYFKFWFKKAERFYGLYEMSLKAKWYEEAAFMLHQATECLYGTVLLVHTNYKPKRHNIKKLRKQAAEQDRVFLKTFPLGTQQERDRFDLLVKAYVGARYDENYKITAEELKYLARCIELLKEQTETSCEKKMESFVASPARMTKLT